MFSTPETSVHVWDKNREISPYWLRQPVATTETHTNDIVKKIKRENKKLKYKTKAKTH